MAQYVATVASGQPCSAPITLDRPERLVGLFVPSGAAIQAALEFNYPVAGNTAPTSASAGWAPLTVGYGSNGPTTICISGTQGWAVVPPATAWARVRFSANAPDVRSCVLVDVVVR